jgi:hypothetical protein
LQIQELLVEDQHKALAVLEAASEAMVQEKPMVVTVEIWVVETEPLVDQALCMY